MRYTVMAAMVAVAALVLTAAPRLAAGLTDIRADQAAGTVTAALAEARGLAMAGGREVRVLIDPGRRSLEVEGGRWYRLPDAVAVSGPASEVRGRGIIVFRPDGGSSGGQVVVSLRGRAWWVTVDRRTGASRRIRAVSG